MIFIISSLQKAFNKKYDTTLQQNLELHIIEIYWMTKSSQSIYFFSTKLWQNIYFC